MPSYIFWRAAPLRQAPPCRGPILGALEPVGTDGTQHLAALDPKSQVLGLFFCLTPKNLFQFTSGKASAKPRWSETHRANLVCCLNKFAKVASAFCKPSGAQQK